MAFSPAELRKLDTGRLPCPMHWTYLAPYWSLLLERQVTRQEVWDAIGNLGPLPPE